MVADWCAFTLPFKGVVLESLEVAFIALTFGANAGSIPSAALAATAAVQLMAIAGYAIRAPLARVPENSMKFVVGVMFTAFGVFWGRRSGRPLARRRCRSARPHPGDCPVRSGAGCLVQTA